LATLGDGAGEDIDGIAEMLELVAPLGDVVGDEVADKEEMELLLACLPAARDVLGEDTGEGSFGMTIGSGAGSGAAAAAGIEVVATATGCSASFTPISMSMRSTTGNALELGDFRIEEGVVAAGDNEDEEAVGVVELVVVAVALALSTDDEDDGESTCRVGAGDAFGVTAGDFNSNLFLIHHSTANLTLSACLSVLQT